MRIREIRKPKDGSDKVAEALSDKIGAGFRKAEGQASEQGKDDSKPGAVEKKAKADYKTRTEPASSVPREAQRPRVRESVERISEAIGTDFKRKSKAEGKAPDDHSMKGAQVDELPKILHETGPSPRESHSPSPPTVPTPVEPTEMESCEVGRAHKVKMYVPMIRGEQVHDTNQLQGWVNGELSGMKHNPRIDELLRDAEAHLKLRAAFGDRTEVRLDEVLEMAQSLGLPSRTARNYVFDGGRPELFGLAESAYTKSEARAILNSIRARMNGADTAEEVVSRLKINGQWQQVQSWKKFDRDLDLNTKYFRFLKVFEEGGTLHDSARTAGVEDSLGLSWLRGVYPNLVRKAIELPRDLASQDAAHTVPEKDAVTMPRHGGKISMARPEVRGVPVESTKQFLKIIDNDFPGIKGHPLCAKLLHETCVHIELYNSLKGREYLNYGEAPELARRFGMKVATIDLYTKRQGRSRLLQLLYDGISKADASAQLERIRKQNNGTMTVRDFNRRFDTFYGTEEERFSKSYAKEQALMVRYFTFLNLYQQGGIFQDIARRARIPVSSAMGILEGYQPRLVRIASRIPEQPPRDGYLWLPTKMRDGIYPQDFIQVPERVTSHLQIIGVANQLEPLDNSDMKRWSAKYGGCEKGEALMYVLGLYITDGAAFNETTHAKSMGIRLSKGYDWSYDVGEGMCYYLGLLGVRAHRVGDTRAKTVLLKSKGKEWQVHQKEKYNWASKNNPLSLWMHRSCLGYSDEVPKKKQDVSADWILKAPEIMRSAFLQGLGDGDGSASPKGRYLCISMERNHDFISKLLGTYGVATRDTASDVVTTGQEEAKTAAAIPMFRFASGRLEASGRIVKRVQLKRGVRKQPLSSEEIGFISSMHSRGMSDWDISEAFLDKFGSGVDERVIGNMTKRFRIA